MSPRLHSIHLQRDAYVYVRQPGPYVRAPLQRRQYALADQARGLGLARSSGSMRMSAGVGTGRHERPGFGPLL